MAKSKFYEQIKSATEERQVEDVYNKGIKTYFNDAEITYPFKCDGFVDAKDGNKILRLIIEYKYDEDLTSKTGRAKVLIQVVHYLKKFEENGEILPNVCLVGDVNECFVLHTNPLLKYLDADCDWSIAPSKAYGADVDTMLAIAEDDEINPFVFCVDENFSFKAVADKIRDLIHDINRYVGVTEHNIATIYNYFLTKVIKKTKSINANDTVAVFIGVITEKENYYKHPHKKGVIVTPIGEIKVNDDAYNAFIQYFERSYTPQEKNRFSEISDRLIEDTNRRNKGEFYTPTMFVDHAHDMMSRELGMDWKEEYVVWDASCGSKNLTRDYKFKELYCSTLEQAELEIGKRYNPEATSFQFDFLNDSLDKLPQGLLTAFNENKPIVFLNNPPYATANEMGTNSKSKKGVAKTTINEKMLNDGIGACSQNLYAQFLYRIDMIKRRFNLTKCYIALYSPTLYLSGTSWKNFRKVFLNDFKFIDAFTFKASYFADVADNWGIAFSLWENGETIDKNNFVHKLVDEIDGELTNVGTKDIYNLDGNIIKASNWVKINGEKTTCPNFKSALNLKENGNNKIINGAFGTFCCDANNVDKNTQGVTLLTGVASIGHLSYTSILPYNFEHVVTLFSARKLINKTWINSKDEYIAPNTEHEKWSEFAADAVVYSLFHSSSNQSSLRNVEYKGKQWNIGNEFFWMPTAKMQELANNNRYDEMYQDAQGVDDRFVCKWLNEHKAEISPEAQAVLDYATTLVEQSMKYRNVFNEDNENYQIMNFDCGWYQIKGMLKEYMPNELKQFNDLYKKLAEKMRPLVYEVGFLR